MSSGSFLVQHSRHQTCRQRSKLEDLEVDLQLGHHTALQNLQDQLHTTVYSQSEVTTNDTLKPQFLGMISIYTQICLESKFSITIVGIVVINPLIKATYRTNHNSFMHSSHIAFKISNRHILYFLPSPVIPENNMNNILWMNITDNQDF